MGKKAVKMSLTEFTGGSTGGNTLPTSSIGKDFAKSKGKGLRDNEGSRAEEGDWGRGGGKGGGFKGRDRDDGDSRAETGDWFAKDRAPDRDGGDRGGRGGFGDRGDRGDRRGGTRNFEDTHADKDVNWRGGGNRGDDDDGGRRRSGFGRDRDDGDRRGGGGRDRRDDGDGFASLRSRGGRDDDEPPQRQKLQLKPRSKPAGEDGEADSKEKDDEDRVRSAKTDPFGGARAQKTDDAKDSAPWKKDKGGDEEDGFETVGKTKSAAAPSTTGKYIAPAQRRRMEEEAARKPEADKEREERDNRRRDDRDERRKPDSRDEEGLSSMKPSGTGAYVNPSKKREMERQAAEEEKARNKKKAEEEQKSRKAAEAEAAKKERLKAQQEAKDQEAREKKEARDKQRMKPGGNVQKEEPCDPDRLEEFGSRCKGVVKDGEPAKKLVKDAADILTEVEFRSAKPAGELCRHLLEHCRRKTDDQVREAVKGCEAIFKLLTKSAMEEGVHRYKVKLLCEAQGACHKMGLPRLSPESALLEVFFDGLYQAEIVEEGYFDLWAKSDDETPGKINSMFQVNEFLEWLRVARVEGEESSDDGEGGGDDSDDDNSGDDSDLDKGPAGYSSRR